MSSAAILLELKAINTKHATRWTSSKVLQTGLKVVWKCLFLLESQNRNRSLSSVRIYQSWHRQIKMLDAPPDHLWLSTPILSLWLCSLKKQETFRCLCPPTAVGRNFLAVQLWQIPARRAEPSPAKSHAAKAKHWPCSSAGKRDPADVTGWGKQAFHPLGSRCDLQTLLWKRISNFILLIVLIIFFHLMLLFYHLPCLMSKKKKGRNKK